ncbi:MAG: DUF47 domain-containing protein [Chitinophagales bacterium]
MRVHLKPRDEEFFTYFNQSSQAVCEGAGILKDFIEASDEGDTKLKLLGKVEARGDKVFATIMERLDKSFITPFEREDIYVLARELNGILEYIHGIMEKMVIYKTGGPKDQYVKDLVDVLQKAAVEIQGAVLDLKSLRTNYNRILESCDKIKEFEHQGDRLYREGIALLFESTDNAIEVIKWKEIFEHLETALDHCEDLSNILKGVAVKYV